MANAGPYTPAWRRYRRWNRAFWILFVLYLPTLAGLNRALGPSGGGAVAAVAIGWLIVWAVAASQTWAFRCPRCGQPFFQKFDNRPWRADWARNPFARRCMNCGLPKWADRDPDSSAAG